MVVERSTFADGCSGDAILVGFVEGALAAPAGDVPEILQLLGAIFPAHHEILLELDTDGFLPALAVNGVIDHNLDLEVAVLAHEFDGCWHDGFPR